MVKNRKRPRKALRYSFAVTFSVLFLLLVAIYVNGFFTAVPVQHLPQTIPSYEASWAKYIPNNVVQFSFQNMSYLRSLNSSLPFPTLILHLSTPRVNITSHDLVSFVAMQFSIPNASVDIAYLSPARYELFDSAFANYTAFAHTVDNNSLFKVLDTATGKPVEGVMALIPSDDAVAFSPGQVTAEQGVTMALKTPDVANSSVVGLPSVNKMLFLAGGPDEHIALGLYGFSTDVAQSQQTLTSVDLRGNSINVSRVVQFADFNTAYGQFSTVKRAYLSGQYFVVFDQFVRVSQLDPFSKLSGDYRLVQ